ncbi:MULTISPECIES: hypothetical protein [unclassified Janthinobacterium]|uniref:hypothetical protein n=1 Tax=unclassified Janthinobacterium TaxID=2610881 RepID=UPI00160A312A|nr:MULTISPECIES: hypothetical protein [unclassified Janthinobacterium]MBB5609941.1 hypothetical protein [Janthinobacterium sp. S3T4]MBB5615039.1 hypothetical protein [Janthinobacterium sp. S3M3]
MDAGALFSGFGTLAFYALALWAMTQAPVAAGAALMRAGCLFTSYLSFGTIGNSIALPAPTAW